MVCPVNKNSEVLIEYDDMYYNQNYKTSRMWNMKIHVLPYKDICYLYG